jgi:hypothetical protein
LKILRLKREKSVVLTKTTRELFTREEDIPLIQLWLNIPKDSIVGVDQKADSFWLRITSNYNEYRGQL